MSISSHIRNISPVSGYEGSANLCVRVGMSCISFLWQFLTWKLAMLAGKTNLQIRQRMVCGGPPSAWRSVSGWCNQAELVPFPATNYCGQRCDRSSIAECGYKTRVKSNLLLWRPSLNKHSKLQGQFKNLKSGCGPSVGPSLSPQSLNLKTNLVTLSL